MALKLAQFPRYTDLLVEDHDPFILHLYSHISQPSSGVTMPKVQNAVHF